MGLNTIHHLCDIPCIHSILHRSYFFQPLHCRSHCYLPPIMYVVWFLAKLKICLLCIYILLVIWSLLRGIYILHTITPFKYRQIKEFSAQILSFNIRCVRFVYLGLKFLIMIDTVFFDFFKSFGIILFTFA